MSNLTTRAGKGSPLTNNELDANFTNLNADKVEIGGDLSGTSTAPNVAKIQGRAVSADAPENGEKLVWNGTAWEPSVDPTGEPIGHANKADSTISFDSVTRTFTIAPVAASFTVWCKGVKHTYTSAQTVVIPDTTGLHFIYFNASGVLSTQMSYFTWEEHAPTAYIYWNATAQQAVYFGDERHGITLDWQTHEYLHRTRGAAIASGFGASGYTTTGAGSTNADAQIDIGGGTFFDEDLQVDIVSTNTPVAGTWQQDLSGPARIPVLYLSGSAWVIDAPTDFPFKVVSGVPQYNLYSGGTWSAAPVANNGYFVSWILATHNLTYPVVAVISQAATNQVSEAEAMTFEGLTLSGFPSVEFRPLYKVIYQHKTSFANNIKASTIAVYDLRSISAAGVAAALVQDHGNLSGLGDDDHAQYLHVSAVRSPSAAVTNSFLPSQTSQSGKYLTTDGSNPSWGTIPSGSLTFTGDVTGSGNTGSSTTLTLANSGVTAGTFTKVTVDAKGRVTNGASASNSDITTALGFTPENAANKAVANGYASLDSSGKVPSNQLPSYVDDVLEYANLAGFPGTGETGKIYVAIDTSKTYRWSGSAYVEISASPGSTDAVTEGSTNLYFTNARARAAVSASGSLSYSTSTGIFSYTQPTNVSAFTNDSGYLTGITGAQVTTALGFTPANSTSLANYLPLTGGALSGAVSAPNFHDSNGLYNANLGGSGGRGTAVGYSGGAYGGIGFNVRHTATSEQYVAVSGDTVSYLRFDGGGFRFFGASAGAAGRTVTFSAPGNAYLDPSGNWYISGQMYATGSQHLVLNTGNYSSYALPLSGGTITGDVGIGSGFSGFNNISGTERTLYIANGNAASLYLHATTGSGRKYAIFSSASGGLSIYDATGDATRFTLNTSSANFSVALQQSGNQVLHAGNYGSGYFKTVNGSSIIGSGDVTVSATDSTKLPLAGGTMTGVITFSSSGTAINLAGQTDSIGYNATTNLGTYIKGTGNTYLYGGGEFYDGTASRQIITSGNYSSYTVARAGGSFVGRVVFPSGVFDRPQFPGGILGLDTGDGNFDIWGISRDYYPSHATASSAWGIRWDGDSNQVRFIGAGTTRLAVDLDGGAAGLSWEGNTVLHAGNYNDYAPSKTGTGANGTWNINVTGNAATVSGITSGQVTTALGYTPLALTGLAGQTSAATGSVAGGGGRWLRVATLGTNWFYGRFKIWDGSSSGPHQSKEFTVSGAFNDRSKVSFVLLSGGSYNYVGVSKVRYLSATTYDPQYLEVYIDGAGSDSTWTVAIFEPRNASAVGFSTGSVPSGYTSVEWDCNGAFAAGSAAGGFRIGYDNSAFVNGNTVLHAGNYNSYSPTLTGSGASGTWGIRITGFANQGSPRLYSTDGSYNYDAANPYFGYLTYDGSRWLFQVSPATPAAVRVAYADSAGSVSNASTVAGLTPAKFFNNMGNNHGTYTDFNSVPDFGAYYVQQGGNSPTGVASHQWYGFTLGLGNEYAQSSYASQLYWPRRAQNGETYIYVRDREGGTWNGWTKIRAGVADSAVNGLTTSNYSSYALPLSGGTMSGAISTPGGTSIYMGSQNVTTSSRLVINFHTDGDYNYLIGKRAGAWTQPLDITFYTGIRYHAHSSYGGHKFYAGGYDTNYVFSVGDGDSHVRVYNNLYVSGDSRGNDVYTTGGWFRNHTNNNGIYWSATGWHLYPANAGNFYVRSGQGDGSLQFLNSGGSSLGYVHAASDSAMGFLNSSGSWRFRVDNSGNARCYNNLYIDQNYGHGIVGVYSPYRYQGVFSMGDAYKLPADGTSTGSLYGMAWSHPYAGGAAGNLTDHGLLIINAGGFRCAISDSIVASSNITAYSDERLKHKWRDMPENFVERLAQVRVGVYERIDDGKEQVGVSAQSLRPLMPQAVIEAKDEIGTLSVSYGNAAMASAVELAKELVMLKKELAEIKSRLH